MAPTLSIPPGGLTPTKIGVHHLPREVGLLIYEFALTEPPRWDKRHNIECQFKPENTEDPEEPPFVQTQVALHGKRWIPRSTSPCSCAKRGGLSLLLTCREISEAATPIFWSKNTFCFLDAVDFLGVARGLRSTSLERIRHISIMNPDPSGHPQHINWKPASQKDFNYMRKFWEALTWCKGLEQLEMPVPYIEWSEQVDTSKYLNQLAEALPALSTLQLNFLLPLSQYDNVHDYPLPMDDYDDHRVTYAGFSHHIALQQHGQWLPETVRELHRDLQSNFRVHVDTAIKTKFCGVDISNLATYRWFYKLSPSLHESSTTRRITLPSGASTLIQFYGLPVTERTKRARRRYILSQQRQENDERLSATQREIIKFQRGQKKASHDEELLDEQLGYEQRLENRERRLVEEQQAERKAEKSKKKKVQKAMRAADESRKLERKRVGK